MAKEFLFCAKSKSFLADMEISFEEIDAPLGSKAWKEMRARTGSGSLPQIKQVIVAAGEGAKGALSAYDYIINQR